MNPNFYRSFHELYLHIFTKTRFQMKKKRKNHNFVVCSTTPPLEPLCPYFFELRQGIASFGSSHTWRFPLRLFRSKFFKRRRTGGGSKTVNDEASDNVHRAALLQYSSSVRRSSPHFAVRVCIKNFQTHFGLKANKSRLRV